MTNKTSILPILFIILVFFGCQQYDENVTPEPEDFFISIEDHPGELKTLKEEFSTQNLNKHTKSRYNSTVLVESIDWTKVRKIEYSDYTVYSVNLRQGNSLANNLLLYKKDGQLKSYILQLDSKTTTDASDGLTCENLEGSTLNIYSLDQDISWSSEGTPSQAGSGGRVADDYCYWVDFWVETWVKVETPVGVTYKVSEPMHYSVLECYDDGMGPGGDGGNGSGDPDGYGDLPDDPNPIIPGGKCPQGLVKDIDDNCVSCPPGTIFESNKCVVDEEDPDFYADCRSWEYVPVGPEGNYQSCGVIGISYDYITSYMDSQGKWRIEYVQYTFDALYFEFPRIRSSGVTISSGQAAQITAEIADLVQEEMETLFGSSPRPTTFELEQGYINAFGTQMAAYGGRISTADNYGSLSLNVYSTSAFGNGDCY